MRRNQISSRFQKDKRTSRKELTQLENTAPTLNVAIGTLYFFADEKQNLSH
jgi:hypothetical protein